MLFVHFFKSKMNLACLPVSYSIGTFLVSEWIKIVRFSKLSLQGSEVLQPKRSVSQTFITLILRCEIESREVFRNVESNVKTQLARSYFK